MLKFIYLFSLFLINSLPLLATGKLIILYGTPCSGKTTLSRQLEKILPDNFTVVKRTKIAHDLRFDHIERITGIRPKTVKEAKMIESSIHFQCNFKEMALGPMIEEIEERLAKGENLVFDVCLYRQEQLNRLNHLNPYTILVYAPLPELSKRAFHRATTRNFTNEHHQNLKRHIVSGFCILYQRAPISQAVDTLAMEDVLNNFMTTSEQVILEFDLIAKSKVGIQPKEQPTLFINTTMFSPLESAIMIKNLLYSPGKESYISEVLK